MIVNLDYQLGGSDLTDLIIKCNMETNITHLKEEYKQKSFKKEGYEIVLDIPKLDDVGDAWRGMLKIPVFHFYNQLYFNYATYKFGFLIDNCFRYNLPQNIKNIIGDNQNIKIYFSPQINQQAIIDGRNEAQKWVDNGVMPKKDFVEIYNNSQNEFLGGNGHLLFRPHYVFIPHPNQPNKKGLNNGADDIRIHSKVQIFAPNGVTCEDNPNIINSYSTPNGLLTHGGTISTQDPKLVGLLQQTHSSFYSIFNSIEGDDSEFHITLHWVLSTDVLQRFADIIMFSDNFNQSLEKLQLITDPDWNELKQSLINLLA